MFCLKSAVYLRPVWYTLSRIRTVTRRPAVVFARSMNCGAMSTVWKIDPLAGARDMREHLVFDRVMLGTVRWIVGHTHFQPQPIG